MKIKRIRKNWPRAFWSILGMFAGAVAGFIFGGVGIAARGHAAGIPALGVAVLFALVGSFAGYRIGLWLSKPWRNKKGAG